MFLGAYYADLIRTEGGGHYPPMNWALYHWMHVGRASYGSGLPDRWDHAVNVHSPLGTFVCVAAELLTIGVALYGIIVRGCFYAVYKHDVILMAYPRTVLGRRQQVYASRLP